MPTLKLKHLRHPFRTAKSYLLTKPNRINLLGSFLRTFTSVLVPGKWVFIVGCYNSGTTLLERLLATHPAISALNEGVFKTDQLITPEELGWTRMWCQVVEQVRLKADDKSVNSEKLKKDWAIFFDKRKPVFLEKSIVNSARMTWLQENFQNSYFIFIVRNGYAVSEGIRRKVPMGTWGTQQNFNPSYPIKMCAQQWVVNNKVIEQDSQAINNFKKVYYEELCKSPRQVIEELWNFIGLSKSKVSNWSKDRKWKIGEKYSVIRNMNERSFANLSPEDIKHIENIASDMLNYYGYPLLSNENRFIDLKM